jgi:actin beta/gamma 1
LPRSGVHTELADAIFRCDVDVRSDFTSNIVLAGGTTLLPGFKERLLDELRGGLPGRASLPLKVVALPERHHGAWIGGSLLASHSSFADQWVSKQEYEESGPAVVQRKCQSM